jgi:putative acetyltransferase
MVRRVMVRRALVADDGVAYEIHRAAFGRELEADLFARLRADGDLLDPLCFVVVSDDVVLGHVAVSRGLAGDRIVPALGPIGVVPDRQRRGVGSTLVHAVVAGAEALGEPCVVLLGSPAYYGRFGFGPAAPLVAPDPAWGDAFQVRRLTAWDPSVAGPFRYAAAFG